MKLVYYFFFLFSFFFLLNRKKDFTPWIPLFYIIYESSFNYFTTLSIVTFIRPLFFLILLTYFIKHIRYNYLTKPLIIFFIYTLLLIPLSSEIFYSFKGYMQVFISMMCFIIGFLYFKDSIRINTLNKSLVGVLIFSVTSSIIGYAFGIGKVLEYSNPDDPETIGLLRSFGLYSAAVVIGILPMVLNSFKNKHWRFFIYLLSIINYIFILLNVRRTAIIIPIIGLLTYAWFMPNKSKILTGLIASFIVLIFLSPFYEDTLYERYKIREEQGRFEEDFYKTEARYLENIQLLNSITSFKEPFKVLFGSKIYASSRDGEKRTRMYHSDSASLIGGTGIIGFIIYIHFIIMLYKFGEIKKKETLNKTQRLYKTTYYSLFFILLFVSLGGSLQNVSLRSLIFLCMGAMLALLSKSNYSDQFNNSAIKREYGII